MSRYIYCFIVFLALAGNVALAQDYSGKYSGPQLSVQIQSADGGKYSGTITLGDRQFPFNAQVQQGKLQGTFSSQGQEFAFTASLNANHLTLVSGTTTYQLDRAAPANPLENAQPVNPLAVPAAATGAAPAGYTVIASAGHGQAIFIQMADAADAPTAIRATIADLNKFFDKRIAVSGAFEDTKVRHSGGASFTAKLKGQAIKGSIICGVGEKGAAVTVVYDRPDAPVKEWSTLLASVPIHLRTKEYRFPDGTGSVEIPDGWKCENQSCVGGVRVLGPDNQLVSIGTTLSVVTPNSTAVQMQLQMEAQARQWGYPAPPPMQLLVAPFSTPVDALKNLIPEISKMSVRNNGPALTLDKIIESTDAVPGLANDKAALIYFAFTKTENNKDVPYRSVAQIEVYSLGQEGWGLYLTELSSKDSMYDRDLPVMMQIAKSFKADQRAVQRVTQDNMQQNNARFAAFEQSMKEKNEAFDRMNEAWRNRQLVQSRSNADFDEVIVGYRTVEDTTTGEHTSVDLGNVHEIVEKLNERDPARFKEIPLRDEMYPIPEGQH